MTRCHGLTWSNPPGSHSPFRTVSDKKLNESLGSRLHMYMTLNNVQFLINLWIFSPWMHPHTHSHTWTHVLTYTLTHMHMRTHSHMHTRTHTHTLTLTVHWRCTSTNPFRSWSWWCWLWPTAREGAYLTSSPAHPRPQWLSRYTDMCMYYTSSYMNMWAMPSTCLLASRILYYLFHKMFKNGFIN